MEGSGSIETHPLSLTKYPQREIIENQCVIIQYKKICSGDIFVQLIYIFLKITTKKVKLLFLFWPLAQTLPVSRQCQQECLDY